MIIESGVIIFLSLIVLFVKLPRRMALKLLGRPLLLDTSVAILAYILHYGTFSGMMAAAVAACICAGFTSFMRWGYGYIERNVYHPGKLKQFDPRTLV